MLKFLDKLFHRLWLLRHGDDALQASLERCKAELHHVRRQRINLLVRLHGRAKSDA